MIAPEKPSGQRLREITAVFLYFRDFSILVDEFSTYCTKGFKKMAIC